MLLTQERKEKKRKNKIKVFFIDRDTFLIRNHSLLVSKPPFYTTTNGKTVGIAVQIMVASEQENSSAFMIYEET